MEYEAKDLNLYRYLRNSPTNATDPTGKAWWNPCCRESLEWFVAHSCIPVCRFSLDVRDSAHAAERLGQAFADRVFRSSGRSGA